MRKSDLETWVFFHFFVNLVVCSSKSRLILTVLFLLTITNEFKTINWPTVSLTHEPCAHWTVTDRPKFNVTLCDKVNTPLNVSVQYYHWLRRVSMFGVWSHFQCWSHQFNMFNSSSSGIITLRWMNWCQWLLTIQISSQSWISKQCLILWIIQSTVCARNAKHCWCCWWLQGRFNYLLLLLWHWMWKTHACKI